nr:LysR family transcriptional regulator [Rhabdothermincola salaria]
MRYVVATAELGTMTSAAAACHVGQPALTRAVRALERELGLTMFVRRGRSVELTAEGEEVVAIARRVLGEVDALERLSRRGGRGQGLKLAATPTIQADLGSGLIRDYWRDHPEHPVRFVHCESRLAVAEAVRSGRADVGVADLPIPDDGLETVPFEWRDVVLLGPPGTGLPDPFPVARLAEVRLITTSRGGHRRAEFDGLFAELGVTPDVAFESDERASWIPAVLAGVGCCLWYRSQGESASLQGIEVVALEPALGRAIGVVHRRGPLATPVAALVDAARRRADAR